MTTNETKIGRGLETSGWCAALLICVATRTFAAELPTTPDGGAVVEFLRDPVVLYVEPDRASRSDTVPRAQLALPLPVTDEDGDFVKVRTREGERWVSIMAVRLNRQSVSCAAQKTNVATRDYAASRGAGEKCK